MGQDSDADTAGRRWRWLESTRVLQREAYGWEPPTDPAGQAASLKENALAALVEIAGEAVREFHWKFWSHDAPWVNRENLLNEIVDAQHFLANMLVTIGVTDEEYERAYRAKQAVNRKRQLDGYRVQKIIEDRERPDWPETF
jgi:hypothetical protein